jgi:transposase InsO family protein
MTAPTAAARGAADVVASVKANEAALEVQGQELKDLLEDLTAAPGEMLLQSLEHSFRQYQETCGVLYDRYKLLAETDPTVLINTTKKCKDLQRELRAVRRRVDAVHRSAKQALGLDAATPTSAAAVAPAAGTAKIIDSLKPSRLTMQHQCESLTHFLTQFRSYYTASRMDKFELADQRAFLLNCLDSDLALRITSKIKDDTVIFRPAAQPGHNNSCEILLRKDFEQRFPLFIRRWKWFQLTQKPGQNFTEFTNQLTRMGAEAALDRLTDDELFVFRLLTGISDDKLLEHLLKLDKPTLETLLKEADIYISMRKNTKLLAEGKRPTANSLSHQQQQQKKQQHQNNSRSKNNSNNNKKRSKIPAEFVGLCLSCGSKSHARSDCTRQKDVSCDHCKTKGSHSTSVCINLHNQRKKSTNSTNCVSTNSFLHMISTAYTRDRNFLQNLFGKSRPTPRMDVTFESPTTGKSFSFVAMPDSGASRSTCAYNVMMDNDVPIDRCNKERLFAANGTEMHCEGSVQLSVKCNGGKCVTIDAIVSSDLENEILLSWHDLIKMGVLSEDFPKVHVMHQDYIKALCNEFSDVLSDQLGDRVMKGPPMHISLRQDPNFKPPKVWTARRTPLHLQDAAAKELQRLLDEGTIEPVTEPSVFCNPARWIEKPGGGVRLVSDQKCNPICERNTHVFPTREAIIQSIPPDSKFFAKLDATSGYHQIALDEESSKLTTFLLPTGRYRYKRAPMGLSASGDEWCRRSDEALAGLEGICKLIDDIIVFAPNMQALLARVRAVLLRCREHGITISRKKLQIAEEVKFAGYLISREGIRVDPAMLAAIANFPAPTDITSLRSFLGLANQLGSFLPDLAHNTRLMRQLLKKDVAWLWSPEIQIEFDRVKKLLTSDAVVKPFDRALKTELLTDASRLHGLGFVLLQRESDGKHRLITCGSRALLPAESRYATIELELLAISWATEKCKYFLLGLPQYSVLTDHRPLVGIMAKDLPDIENLRLQRIRETLLPYTFNTIWVPGKTHEIADALSRHPVFQPDDSTSEYVNTNLVCNVMSDPALAVFFDAIDDDYLAVASAVRKGRKVKSLPPTHPARLFSSVWDRLSLLDDEEKSLILLDDERIVVPAAARPELLRRLHLSHSGLVKTRKQCRQEYFWPSMNADIEALINNCEACLSTRPSLTSEPFAPDSPAPHPMFALGLDLADFQGRTYLIIVDRFSGYPFCFRLNDQTTEAVLKKLEEVFCIFGLPERIRCDNGPCFASSSFKSYCSDNFIKCEFSSPYYSVSNGMSESSVKNMKMLLRRCHDTDEDFQQALLHFRCTPRDDGFSPAEMFLGRRPRTLLPTLPPPAVDLGAAAAARQRGRDRAREQHDKAAHALPALDAGDAVVLQHPITKKWDTYATVSDVRESGRSYIVKTDDGRILTRNRRFIRPRPAPPTATSPPPSPRASSPSPPPPRRSSRRPAARPARYR